MKKIFLTISLAIFGLASAQTEKSTFIISGQTGLGFLSKTEKLESNGQTIRGPKTSSFNISPSAGYFIIDNLAISLDFDYKTETAKQEVPGAYDPIPVGGFEKFNSKNTQSTLFIVPTISYFFSKGKLRPYLTAGAGWANIKQEFNSYGTRSDGGNTFSSYNDKNDGFVWATGGGLAYFVSKVICFDLALGYAKYTYKDNDIKTKSGALGTNIGISVFLK